MRTVVRRALRFFYSCDCMTCALGQHCGSWKCPDCGQTWRWNPNAGTGTDLWHGRDNVRTASGAKPKGGFWAWLTS